MKGKLKILMVFSEVTPFSRDGDLGDVGEALPKVLKEMGHDVRVITPQYRVTNERKYILRDVIRLQNIEVPFGKKTVRINVKSAFLPNSKVQVYFINYKPFFFRDGLYADVKNGKEYSDNDKRFILFSKGILETLIKLQWQPDVIHCHDWQTGLVPFFLKEVYKDNPFFSRTFSLLTVHNFAFQGNFDSSCVQDMGLDGDFVFSESGLEFDQKCSFLKAGIVYADVVNTVSKKYAQEVLLHPNLGCGMEKVLKLRSDRMYSVNQGIDYSIWNPEVDIFIPEKYDINHLSGKEKNKRALLEKFDLSFVKSRPIVAIVLSSADHNGMDLLRDAFHDLMRFDIYVILVGEGSKSDHRFFEKASNKYRDRVGVCFMIDEAMSHLVEAGADIALVISKYEPSGLNRLRGLKYGTIPVARATGGLADAVLPFNLKTGKGIGFVFNGFSSSHFLNAVKQAVKVYQDQKTWIKIMKNAMREDFSWQVSAKNYIQLYSKCIATRGQ